MDNDTKRNLTVLAVVVACFAVLWPKIFYPMILSILFPPDTEAEIQEEIKKLNFDNMLHPQMREAMGEARPAEKPSKEGNKVFFHPSLRYMAKPPSKEPGAVNFVIPVYTIAIILFFMYSVLKTVFKKHSESYYSYNCNQQKMAAKFKSVELEEIPIKRKENSQERKTQLALEQYGKDKVLTALKTIILEMEDFKGNISERDSRENIISESLSESFSCDESKVES